MATIQCVYAWRHGKDDLMKFKLSSDFECSMLASYRLAGTVDLLGISYAIIFRIYREGFFFFFF